MKFRIKVEELNNGEKLYTPQAKVNWYDFEWENICYGGIYGGMDTYRYTSIVNRQIYKTKEEALREIQIYKSYSDIESGEKVKKITYLKVK